MTTATQVIARGTFGGQKAAAVWRADMGFKPTGIKALDIAIMRTAAAGVAVGGTFYPEENTAQWAVAVLCKAFGNAPEITANGEIPPLPYEAGEDAIY